MTAVETFCSSEHDNMIGYRDRVPGFEARTAEAIMQRATPPIADTVREFMPVRQVDLDALSRDLDALDR
ncbi:hypothetical protein C8E08_3292 [Paracidovorax citrulli]|uniref:Uncharacterized protein n=2 Tax=Paracidovorax citrulli TaxID=80869 RepID=A1TL84_PARC0|nr:hypothetical protein Aave_1128 [Paracidovorax citrulli AAC00-1]ATG95205.1 hypothetical protein CQB05_15215 [Paracidovorax citrulli]MVT29299.1 hypothetical protein [Paracidovorax citrulli]MVT38262.1 hypothetical protein [Paracidovorax citrulli]PVY65907.1 hypothetical protein C8E08_3292 [Paracidovorax citrulli]